MALCSMTGFARSEGSRGRTRWAWEIKTVNGKSLDLRFRLPPGFDAVEAAARAALAAAFVRGSCQISLQIRRESAGPTVRINQPVLDAVLAAMAEAGRHVDAAAPRLDGLFAIRGVVEVEEAEETEAERAELTGPLLDGFREAVAACLVMRRGEGEALRAILAARLDEIEALTAQAEANPARQPAAIRARLAAQIATLVDAAPALDPDRLHQEALLLAAKVDIREELDRLRAHVSAARAMLAENAAVGRRLDFLAQEFNRETNTLCSKSNDISLTTAGLSLKVVVEQFREQVQNLE